MGFAADGLATRTLQRPRRAFAAAVGNRPHVVLAVKAAVAAGLAWLLALPLGGAADDYWYYAPLGAVVVMSTTVMTSVRAGLQALAAIALGAALSVSATQLPLPRVVHLVLVIGLGMLLASWRRLGAMGVWVPFAALFVLVFGSGDPAYYIVGYAGLTGMGAAVGVVVNLAAPQLPLGRTLHSIATLRDELVQQLRAIAHDLRTSHDLGSDDRSIGGAVAPRARHLEELVTEVREARRVNWRAGRWRQLADRHEERAHALEYIAQLVDEVGTLLTRSRTQLLTGRSEIGDCIARALESTAQMLEDTDIAAPERVSAPSAQVRRDIAHLRWLVIEHGGPGHLDDEEVDGLLIGASVTVGLERAVEAWE